MSEGAPASLRTKFGRFNWEERRAFGEALMLVILAAPVVRFLPLRWIGHIASAGPFGRPPANADRGEVITWMVAWAVDRAAKRSPFRAKCFEQGLAAQIMLRRRGIDSTLLYGVTPDKNPNRPLRAHVWIETDRFPVVGDSDPDEFALLATWPEGRKALWANCTS